MSERQNKPQRIHGASNEGIKLPHHWGKCAHLGTWYRYNAVDDMLIREDVFYDELCVDSDQQEQSGGTLQKELF